MEENEEFDSDLSTQNVPISEGFWNYMENYWHNNREFPESTESSLNKKADLVGGKVPASQLPSYVDDVLEFESFENLPNPGEKGKIYVATNDNSQYRWSGAEYIQINSAEDLMTINTDQDIVGKKYFITSGGSTDQNNKLIVASLDHSLPGMTFHKSDFGSGNINFNENGFNFVNAQASDYLNVNANGFKKSQSNDDYFLTGGGGHQPISDFAQASDLSLYHKKDPLGALNNVSDSHINQTWFDYNWANTGLPGSVINFSGLGGNYSTELFGQYNGNALGFRTKNGDANVWSEPKFIWHNHNFNPSDKVPYTGADKPVNLNGQNLSNVTRLLTNGSIKHNGLGLSLINASGSGGYNSVLVKTGLTTGNMGTFTVKLYHYAHEYFEFNVNNYKYNNSNYATNITWKAGNSKRIEKIEFLKDSSDNLYINIVSYLAYPRIAITDLMVYGWDDVPFEGSNWSIEFNGSTTNLINEGQAIPANFLRDEGLDTMFNSKYWEKSIEVENWNSIDSDMPFAVLNGTNAQQILSGGLLASDSYSDETHIPLNGIYSKGNIKTLNYGSAIEWAIAYSWTQNEGATLNWVSQNHIPKTHPAYNITFANIGNWLSYTNHNYNMSIQPDQVANNEFQTGFGSWNNNAGDAGGYMDYIHFGGYADSSGGNQNLIAFRKNGPGLRQFQNTKGSSTIYGANGTYVDYWHSGNLNPTDYITQLNLNNLLDNYIPKAIQQVLNFNTISPTTSGIYRTNNNDGGVKYLYSPMLHLGGSDTATQMQVDYYTGELSYRGGFNGAWNTWRTAWDNGNFNPADYATTEQLSTAINNGNTAFDWGNHASAGYAQAWDNASAVGFESGNPEQPYIYHNTDGYKFLATKDWVYSQDYTTPAFVEESIEQLNVEFTDPDYPVHVRKKFVTIIITDDLSQGYIDLEDDSIPGQQLTIINLASSDMDLIRNGNLIDKILSRETTEYYTSDHHRFIKKGSYKSAGILN